MRYADMPTAEAVIEIGAPAERVWALVSDINLPARFSSEFKGGEWLDEGPALGARFVGRSGHAAIGEWQTTCTLTGYEELRVFEWTVGEAGVPVARWRFELEPTTAGVRLRQWAQMGPGPSGADAGDRAHAGQGGADRGPTSRGVVQRIGIWTPPPVDAEQVDFAREAERLGVNSLWSAEAWSYDALTPLGYLAAITERVRLGTGIVQLGARTPANLAMAAMALQAMSHGRFILGLGTSGPQVMEGWHGVRFTKPITRTEETISITGR